jgi:tRNA-specific 2-thiouridylase
MHYTVGQRKGFDIPLAQQPYYVLKIIPEKNQIVVGLKDSLEAKIIKIKDCNFFIQDKEFKANVKLRYSKYGHSCSVKRYDNYSLIYLDKSEFAVALGQGAVFYNKDKVLGGGWIDEVE